jgi:hypothetical protein
LTAAIAWVALGAAACCPLVYAIALVILLRVRPNASLADAAEALAIVMKGRSRQA